MKSAKVAKIAAAFGVVEGTLWTWHRTLKLEGFVALAGSKRGPKGGSKLTNEVFTRNHELKQTGLDNARICAQVGVSVYSVRRAFTLTPAPAQEPTEAIPAPALASAETTTETQLPAAVAAQRELPLLSALVDRTAERLAVSANPAARVAARLGLASERPGAALETGNGQFVFYVPGRKSRNEGLSSA